VKLLGDDEGVLVEPKKVEAIIDAMRFLAENTDIRQAMGERCRRKVEEKYSWHSQIDQIEEVYRRAIEKRR
jgi:glycosyltransferase involved in cell wall biosynthesis